MFRVYWGPKWTAGNPCPWQQLETAIFTLVRSVYLKGLREYGVASVADVAVSSDPQFPPTTFPTVAFDPTFPSTNDFDEPDVIKVIMGLLDSGKLPRADQIRGTPLYCVIPQQGSYYRPEEPPRELRRITGSISHLITAVANVYMHGPSRE